MFGLSRKSSSAESQSNNALEKKNWYTDRYQYAIVQRNILIFVTIFSLTAVGLSVYAVAYLAKGKSFEPYVIQIEKKTGITTKINQASLEEYKANESIIKYFIHKYVLARESYDVADYEYNYGMVVALLSNSEVRSEFSKEINDPASPKNPINYGTNVKLIVGFKSISFIDKAKNTVQARISIAKKVRGSGQDVLSHYIVTLNYGFFDLSLSSEQRYVNPLGFQVTSYRIDEEIVR